MFDQIKNMFVDELAQKLQAEGYKINADTIKNALANAPHLVQQIEGILASNSPDKLQQITNLLNTAESGQSTATSTETQTSQGSTTTSTKS